MSSYRDFADAVLIALYDANVKEPDAYQRFETVSREGGQSPRRDWITRFVEEVGGNGFAQVSKHIGNPADWRVRIRAAGSEYVEEVLNHELHPPSPERVRELPAFSSADFSSEDFETDEPTDKRIDSVAWTGLPSDFVFSGEKISAFVRLIDETEAAIGLSSATQFEKAQARAFIVAMRALAEAPEPQVDIIWELLGRANNIAGIAGLFISLIGLFT